MSQRRKPETDRPQSHLMHFLDFPCDREDFPARGCPRRSRRDINAFACKSQQRSRKTMPSQCSVANWAGSPGASRKPWFCSSQDRTGFSATHVRFPDSSAVLLASSVSSAEISAVSVGDPQLGASLPSPHAFGQVMYAAELVSIFFISLTQDHVPTRMAACRLAIFRQPELTVEHRLGDLPGAAPHVGLADHVGDVVAGEGDLVRGGRVLVLVDDAADRGG